MALIFTEGFDHQLNATDLGTLFSSTAGWASFPNGRYTGKACAITSTATAASGTTTILSTALPLTKTLPTSYNAGVLGLAFYVPTTGVGYGYVQFQDTTTGTTQNHFTVVLDFTTAKVGYIYLCTGTFASVFTYSSGVVIANKISTSLSGVFTAGTWNYLEVQGSIGTAGSCTVRINGVNAVAVSSVALQSGGVSSFNQISLGGVVAPVTFLIDDMYFCDSSGASPFNSFLGSCHIKTVFPNAAGSYTGFASSGTGANWSNVSESAMDGDTSYNVASAVGTKDTFLWTGNLDTASVVLAVQPKAAVRMDDTNARQMQTYLRSGTTEVGGAAITLLPSYSYATDIYINDPNTGTSWTPAAVNSLEFGYNIVK